ncbi:MAG: HipA family kinase, partial [Tunicatimonas sp.]|uniref:HipA family kinase n=1 Tax=Tunicatimonas sp. TaxID=1940096 RepID=UPI003C72077F
MSIPSVHTQYFVEELETDGHAPMKFYCDDGQLYYCKYRLNLKKEIELDFLIYEVVAHELLQWLNIPTPTIAFVAVTEGSFDRNQLRRNKSHCEAGIICFGSQEVLSRILSPIESISSKHDFNQLDNPLDLLRIALFDQWVGNADRGKPIDEGYNFNLLIADQDKKLQYVAFDHAFIFGGENQLRIFNPQSIRFQKGSLLACEYFWSVLRYIPTENCLNAIEQFFVLLQSNEWHTIISNTIAQCATHWPLPPKMEERIINFLSNPERL